MSRRGFRNRIKRNKTKNSLSEEEPSCASITILIAGMFISTLTLLRPLITLKNIKE